MFQRILYTLIAENLLKENNSDEDKYIQEIINLLWSSDVSNRENACLIGNSLISQEEEDFKGGKRSDRPFFEKLSNAVNAEFSFLQNTNFIYPDRGLFYYVDGYEASDLWCKRINQYYNDWELYVNPYKYGNKNIITKINPNIRHFTNLRNLGIANCEITEIPNFINNMSNLTQIGFINNFNIKKYPYEIGKLWATFQVSEDIITHEEADGSLIIDGLPEKPAHKSFIKVTYIDL